MNDMNNGALMNISAENPATIHTRDRYAQAKKRETE